MAITVKHSTLTGLPPDPSAVIDGADWDAAHTVTGAVEAITSSIDTGIPRFSGTNGALQNSSITVDNNGKTFIPDFSSAVDLTGTFVVGAGGLNNSLRSAYQIRRTLSDAGTSFHGFADNTLFNGTTNAGYGSFDSRINYIGTLPNDHVNCFQALLNYNNTAVMQTHQGLVWAPQVNNGQIVSMYAMHVQAPLITAPGVAPTNLAGIVIDDLTGSGGAGILRAILTSGSTPSEFGGLVITYGGVIARAPGLGYLFQSALNATQGSLVHNGTNLTISNFINGSLFLNTNSVNIAEVAPTVIRPVTDSAISLGDATHSWSGVFADGVTLNKNVTTTLPAIGSFAPMLTVGQADTIQTMVALQSFNTGTTSQPSVTYAKARGTAAAPTAVASGDFLGSNFAYGYATSGGAGYVTGAGAGFIVVARDAYTSTVAGTSFDVYATPVGSASVARSAGFGAGVMIGSTTSDPGAGNLRVTNAIKSISPTAGVGYDTGAGGAITQITSRTTGVTLNTVCGAITLFAAAPVVGTWVSFTVTSSAVAATDVPYVAVKSGTNTYTANVTAVAAGSFQISLTSIVGTASDSPVISFSILKAVTS